MIRMRRIPAPFVVLIFVIFTIDFFVSDSSRRLRQNYSSTIQQEYVDYTINRLGLNNNQPIIDFRYRLDIDDVNLSRKCKLKSEPLLLLMAYVSAPDNFQRRQLIRQSWADHDDDGHEDDYQLIFLVGRSASSAITEWRLANESLIHRDVVQVNVIDSYWNLTLKSVALFHWASIRCPGAQFIIKSDDDNYVNTRHLLRNGETLTSMSSPGIYGTANAILWPSRDIGHRHYISREMWPFPRYPMTLMGGAYLVSGGLSIVQRLLAAIQSTPLFPLEDIYIIGLCAPRVDIPIRYTSRFYQPKYPAVNNLLDACKIRNAAIWNVPTVELYSHSHNVTLDVYRHRLKCSRNECRYGACW